MIVGIVVIVVLLGVVTFVSYNLGTPFEPRDGMSFVRHCGAERRMEMKAQYVPMVSADQFERLAGIAPVECSNDVFVVAQDGDSDRWYVRTARVREIVPGEPPFYVVFTWNEVDRIAPALRMLIKRTMESQWRREEQRLAAENEAHQQAVAEVMEWYHEMAPNGEEE